MTMVEHGEDTYDLDELSKPEPIHQAIYAAKLALERLGEENRALKHALDEATRERNKLKVELQNRGKGRDELDYALDEVKKEIEELRASTEKLRSRLIDERSKVQDPGLITSGMLAAMAVQPEHINLEAVFSSTEFRESLRLAIREAEVDGGAETAANTGDRFFTPAPGSRVRDLELLEALPEGSIVIRNGRIAEQKKNGEWWTPGNNSSYKSRGLWETYGGYRDMYVVYIPENYQ